MTVSNVSRVYTAYQFQSAAPVARMSRAEERKDTVAISNQARDYSTARSALKNTPDVREDLVNSIRERIKSGTYNVSSEDIANKLLG